MRGSGAFATSTYTSAFTTALASEEAACAATPARATIAANADAHASCDASCASTWADKWCRQISIANAQDTAWAIAAAASSWITVGRYGVGANPILDGGGTQDVGVKLDRSGLGGWRVRDLEIRNFDRVGIDYENQAGFTAQTAIVPLDFTGPASGVWLHDLSIHDISMGHGTCPAQCPPAGQVQLTGYYYFVAAGTELVGTNYTRVEDVAFSNTDVPWHQFYGRHWMYRDITSSVSYWEHSVEMYMNYVSNRNLQVASSCSMGYPTGSAGLFLAVGTDVSVLDSTITGTPSGQPSPINGVTVPDGVGIDFEADIDNGLVDSCVIGGAGALANDGAALLAYDNPAVPTPPGPANGTNIWSRNTLTLNGALEGQVAIGRAGDVGNEGDMLWSGNTVTRGVGQQLWNQVGVGNVKPTDWLFGADNTVTP